MNHLKSSLPHLYLNLNNKKSLRFNNALSRIVYNSTKNLYSFNNNNGNIYAKTVSKFRPILIDFNKFRTFSIETFIDEKSYELIADETLDLLSEKLENLVEKLDPNVSDIVFNVSFQFKIFHISFSLPFLTCCLPFVYLLS